MVAIVTMMIVMAVTINADAHANATNMNAHNGSVSHAQYSKPYG
jgi:hypothetical protein